MQDAGDGRGEEPVRAVVELEGRPDEQQLRQRVRVEGEGHLGRDQLVGRAPVVRACPRNPRAGRVRHDPLGDREPIGRLGIPGESELGQAGRGRAARRRLELGRGQQVGERVQVIADADASLRAGLERGSAAAGERVENDIAGSRIARDEGMREGGRKARQVRAHRVERVAPQALLRLPFGLDGHRRQIERQLKGELGGGCSARATPSRSDRHGLVVTSMARRRSPIGAMGRGV